MTERLDTPIAAIAAVVPLTRVLDLVREQAPSRMTMSPPPAEPPVMPPPRAVAMRAKRAPSLPTPGNGPLRMTMSLDRRWSS